MSSWKVGLNPSRWTELLVQRLTEVSTIGVGANVFRGLLALATTATGEVTFTGPTSTLSKKGPGDWPRRLLILPCKQRQVQVTERKIPTSL